MTHRLAACAAPLLLLAFVAAAPAAEPLTEKQKIEALIKHVEGLGGAVFIRNGSAYDAKTAATFLRRKWEAQGSGIKTAEEFIDKIASSSGTSGKPYQIRLKGEKEMKAGDYLRAQLKKLEKTPKD